MKHLLIHRHHHRPHHQVFVEMENHIGSHPNGNLKFKGPFKEGGYHGEDGEDDSQGDGDDDEY